MSESMQARLPIYKDRWDNLESIISGHWTDLNGQLKPDSTLFKRRFPGPALPDEDDRRLDSANITVQLLAALKDYGHDEFNEFYEGFQTPKEGLQTRKLKPDPDFPEDAVLNSILDQAATDLEGIQLAAWQRIFGMDETKTALLIGDQLAYQALRPAIDEKWINADPIVITYFKKSASIRVIPYADVVLISVPFTCNCVPRDYLAIPHEVGHYVYWNGHFPNTPGKTIPQTLKEQPEYESSELWVKNWTEEIWADIYGCWIGGPVFALDFQDIEIAMPGDSFTEDDGEHPVPILRPSVRSRALRKAQSHDWSEWADLLDERWKLLVDERWKALGDKRQKLGAPGITLQQLSLSPNPFSNILTSLIGTLRLQFMNLIDAQKAMEKITDSVYAKAKDLDLDPSNPWKFVHGCSVPTRPDDWDETQADLKQALAGPVQKVEQAQAPQRANTLTTHKWADDKENLLKQIVGASTIPTMESDWSQLLDEQGWVTKGPHGRK